MSWKKAVVAGVLLLLAIAFAGSFWPEKLNNETSDVFSHGDVSISQGQSVGKLLAVEGKVILAGKLSHWLAVIGGDLTVKAGADLTGGIFVLSGRLTIEPGANFSPSFWLVLPPGSPYISLLAWVIAGSIFVVALFTAIVIWAFLRWLRRVDGYNRFLRHIPVPFRRWPGLFALTGLAISGFLLALFVHLARETVYYHEADFLDQVIIWLARYYASPALDKVMVGITYVGSGYAYLFFSPVILAVLFWRRRWREGLSLLICLAGAGFLNFLLKNLFLRARPDAFRVISESGFSFPSGHAMVSLCFYGMIAYIWGRQIPSQSGKTILYTMTAALVMAIGFSRVYLGVHYPSDVAGGYVAGATWLAFCVVLLWWWENKKEPGR